MKTITLNKAVSVARKSLPFESDSLIRENLEYAADDIVEAYKIGADEAQREIVMRLLALKDSS